MSGASEHIRVGVAGFGRPDWSRVWDLEGRVVPEARRWAHVAGTFGCLELDSTRYVVPAAQTVERWRAAHTAAAPPRGCPLVVDLPEALLAEPTPSAADFERFVRVLQPLARARCLGALLARFDSRFLYGPAEARRLGHIARELAPWPLVLDVQHPSWWDPRALDSLRGAGWSLAHVDAGDDWRRRPTRHAPTGPIGLMRLYGRAPAPELGDYLYTPPEVGVLARRAVSIAAEVETCWVLAANAVGGRAVATALELRWLIEQAGPLDPGPTLLHAFPHLSALASPPPRLVPGTRR